MFRQQERSSKAERRPHKPKGVGSNPTVSYEKGVCEMSTLIVEVCQIQSVLPHANADRLELAQIKGWQCVVSRGKYRAGDIVTYVPVDAVLPDALAERLGVTKYLSKGRVRCARLRGEPSFGLIIDRENEAWAVGTDVREHYGIEKYLPPLTISAEGADVPHPLFVSYTELSGGICSGRAGRCWREDPWHQLPRRSRCRRRPAHRDGRLERASP